MHTTFERPFKPIELTSAPIEAFDLQALAKQLMAEKPFTEHGRNGLTLMRDNNHTMVLTVARAGTVCQEHTLVGPTTMIMLSGSVTLITAGNGHQMALSSGTAVAFTPDVMHRIQAHTDSAFLTMIGGKQ